MKNKGENFKIRMLTDTTFAKKGDIFEFINGGVTTWNSGYKSNRYLNYNDFTTHNPSFKCEEVIEAIQPKVGDYIKIVKVTQHTPNIKLGDIHLVKKTLIQSGYIATDKHNVFHIKNRDEYEILENYKPIIKRKDKVARIQSIIIVSDGVRTLAEHIINGKVVKNEDARCNPNDVLDFKFGAKLAFGRLMEGKDVDKIETVESSFNFKVKCLDNKSNKCLYTKGKTYEVKDGIFTNDYGRDFWKKFENIEELNIWSASKFELVRQVKKPKIVEVKRKAKVGEYVKIINSIVTYGNYKDGDILQIIKNFSMYIDDSVRYGTEHNNILFEEEYVVLENYSPLIADVTAKGTSDLSTISNEDLISELAKRMTKEVE